jgi:hypothetical protein
MQSMAKDAEIQRQIALMLELGVIKPNFATNYSHAPKPVGKWRFFIDYRLLNDMTESLGGVIPQIFGVLQRIGNHHPKIFGTMDLTGGYHQTALADIFQEYTAFITPRGLYKFTSPIRPPRCTELLPSAHA